MSKSTRLYILAAFGAVIGLGLAGAARAQRPPVPRPVAPSPRGSWPVRPT